MQIKVSFFGAVQSPWPEQSRDVNARQGARVEDLLDEFGIHDDDVLRLCIMINGKRCELSAELCHGDRMEVVMLAGGG